jgi:fucose permease
VGSWDVAMNVEGADVERRLGRTVMPHYHAGFSLGTVAAAGLGALASWARFPVVAHLVLAVALALAVVLWATRNFLPQVVHDEHGDEQAPRARHPLSYFREPRTLLVGVVVLAAAFTEGAANDWLSVGIQEGYRTDAWVGVLGFAAFVTAMTVGRVLGTRWLDTYGRVKVLWAAFALAGVGALLVILGPSIGLVAAFVGALMWGVGASLGFPVGMSAAADDALHAAPRVSVVASIGYCAFLAGPPLLGFLGDHHGVLASLLVVVALTIPALLVVPATKPLPGSDADRAERRRDAALA